MKTIEIKFSNQTEKERLCALPRSSRPTAPSSTFLQFSVFVCGFRYILPRGLLLAAILAIKEERGDLKKLLEIKI